MSDTCSLECDGFPAEGWHAGAVAVRIDSSLEGIDWAEAKADLAMDAFDNGRSPEALRRSFEQSQHVAFARDGGRVVGMARLLSDGVCNAYLVDVWTSFDYRRQGIATSMMRLLIERCRDSTSGCRPTTRRRCTRRSAFARSPSSGRSSSARGSTTTRTARRSPLRHSARRALNPRSRSEFETTKMLENAIAPPAISGFRVAGRRERQRGDVVGERPEEVALDRRQRPPREANRVAGGVEIAGDERQVARLDRHVGPGADREAEIGLRQRGRVVDAVADHRDDRSVLLQSRATTAALSAGRTSAIDVVDADLARRRRAQTSSLSPVRSTGRRPSRLSSAIAPALDGLTVSATTKTARALPSHAAAIAVLPSACASRRRTPSGPSSTPHSSSSDGRPTTSAWPSTTPCDAEAVAVLEGLDRREPALSRSGACDRAGDRMLRGVLDGSDEPQRLARSTPSAATTSTSAILPSVTVPRLVEDDRVDATRRLEHLRALDQDPELRAAAGADEQRGRRRESERTRAGDDQDGDRRREGERQPGAGSDPVAERRGRDRDHRRDEDGGDAVGETLHWRLTALGVVDELRDLRERGFRADALGPDDEAAADVDGRAGDGVADTDLDGDALPGEQRLVDRGTAFDDDTVGRHLLAGTDDEEITGHELLDRDAPFGAVDVEDRELPWHRARRAPARWTRHCAWRAPRSNGPRAGR